MCVPHWGRAGQHQQQGPLQRDRGEGGLCVHNLHVAKPEQGRPPLQPLAHLQRAGAGNPPAARLHTKAQGGSSLGPVEPPPAASQGLGWMKGSRSGAWEGLGPLLFTGPAALVAPRTNQTPETGSGVGPGGDSSLSGTNQGPQRGRGMPPISSRPSTSPPGPQSASRHQLPTGAPQEVSCWEPWFQEEWAQVEEKEGMVTW